MAPAACAPPKPEIGFRVKEDAVPYRTKRRFQPQSALRIRHSAVLSQADPGTGKFVKIRDGSVRWPAGRAALDKIGPPTLFRALNLQLSTLNLTSGSPSRAATSPPRDTFLCRNPRTSTTVAN